MHLAIKQTKFFLNNRNNGQSYKYLLPGRGLESNEKVDTTSGGAPLRFDFR